MTLTLRRGGAFQIADTMYQYVKREAPDVFTFNKRITAIRTVKDANGKVIGIDVAIDNNASDLRFSHVVTSIPLPVLRTVDLTAADLTPMQLNALRHLTYSSSIKIRMQFRSAWWTLATNRAGRRLNIVGGQTYTDSLLRRIAYPSFGDVAHGKTTTLIASYCWTDDAERLGALTTNEELKPCLCNLYYVSSHGSTTSTSSSSAGSSLTRTRGAGRTTHAQWVRGFSADSRATLSRSLTDLYYPKAHSRSSGRESSPPCTRPSLSPPRLGISTLQARRSARAIRGSRARSTVHGAPCMSCSWSSRHGTS